MKKKVSVIIPVYNSEPYLQPCIESLRAQTLRDCEFIFVNDGSKDNSAAIIATHQQQDERIVLINQHNQGVSVARNNGLAVACGEYIAFVDADDYVQSDLYERLYQEAKVDDCDVVLSHFESEMNGCKSVTTYPFPTNVVVHEEVQKDVLTYFLQSDNLNSVVNKLYKKELLDQYVIRFPIGMALGEDGRFNMFFFSHVTRMKYIPYVGYYYREVAGSATRNIAGKDYFQRAHEVYKMELPPVYKEWNPEKIQQLKATKLIHNVISYIHMYFTPSSLPKRWCYEYVRNMVRNESVQEALRIYEATNPTLGRYEKIIVWLMKQRLIFGLYGVTAYSRFRNR